MAISLKNQMPWYGTAPAWLFGVSLLIIFTATAGWMLRIPDRPAIPNVAKTSLELARLLEMQQRRNAALQGSSDSLRESLEAKVCDTLHTEELIIPEGEGASDEDGLSSRLDKGNLVALLEQASVIVLAEKSSGSGFFVTPQVIATNAHVVDEVSGDTVKVTSKALGRSLNARILHRQHDEELGGRDYALLKLVDGEAPSILKLSLSAEVLDEVVAAGYPGDYLRLWNQSEDSSGIPDLILRRGEIVYIDSFRNDIPMVNHTAEIFEGNSGGPLADWCGRAVGINTLYLSMPATSTPGTTTRAPNKIDFAIGSPDLLRFLEESGIAPTLDDSACPEG